MSEHTPTRRALLAGSAAAIGSSLTANTAEAANAPGDVYQYEIRRGDAEWRALLTPDEYRIMRGRETELPRTSPLWNETRAGRYYCKGCGLTLYESGWKVELDIGWLFFRHSCAAAILMSIDRFDMRTLGEDPHDPMQSVIEAHCRRCGSHLGHIVTIRGDTLHCINGTSLEFVVAEA